MQHSLWVTSANQLRRLVKSYREAHLCSFVDLFSYERNVFIIVISIRFLSLKNSTKPLSLRVLYIPFFNLRFGEAVFSFINDLKKNISSFITVTESCRDRVSVFGARCLGGRRLLLTSWLWYCHSFAVTWRVAHFIFKHEHSCKRQQMKWKGAPMSKWC